MRYYKYKGTNQLQGSLENKALRAARQRMFLDAYAKTGSYTKAGQYAGIDIALHYYWLHKDPSYSERFEEASQCVGDVLEGVAIDRAVNGTLRGVYYKGEKVDTEIEYHDRLLTFVLKGAKPYKYADRVDLTSQGRSLSIIIGGHDAATPAQQSTDSEPDDIDDQEIAKLIRQLEAEDAANDVV